MLLKRLKSVPDKDVNKVNIYQHGGIALNTELF